MKRQHRHVIALSLLLLGTSTPSFAGNNDGAKAWLSWDREGKVSTLRVPRTNPFPLFLHLDGAPDVRQLAVELRWMPYDSTGCYKVVPVGTDLSCGWTADVPPGLAFEGDSTFTWSILFSPTVTERSCVVYWVSMASCDSAPPGKFDVYVRVRDSNKVVDRVRNVGDTKILGGPLPDTIPTPIPFSSPQMATTTTLLTLTATPNPGRAPIALRFTLPSPMQHSLGIYDLSGRLLRNIPAQREDETAGSFQWDFSDAQGRAVRPGVYFARLFTPHSVRVLRLTVVR